MKKKNIWLILSVFFLVMLTIGILMMGRDVTVTVDGKTAKVHTYALTVGQMLRQEGYSVSKTDSIQPSAGTWLAGVETVTLNHCFPITLWVWPTGTMMTFASPVNTPRELLEGAGIDPADDDIVKINGTKYTLDDDFPQNTQILLQYLPAVPVSVTQDGKTSEIRAAGVSAGKALWSNGIQLIGADRLSVPFTSSLTSGQEITLTRAKSLTIQVDGQTIQSLSSASTVGQALQENGIALQDLDYSKPSEDSPLPEDGNIRVVRVREEVQDVQQSIAYKTTYQVDTTLDSDKQMVLTPGEEGIQVARTRIIYEDGVETSRETEEATTLVEPVDEVIAYGTGITLNTIDTEAGTLTYYRTESVYVTSYSPCRIDAADGTKCSSTTASGAQLQKGIIATSVAWYQYFQGSQIYIPGYGIGTVADTGGGIPGRYWIDLGYSDSDWQTWSSWVTVYFLTPAPSYVPAVLP